MDEQTPGNGLAGHGLGKIRFAKIDQTLTFDIWSVLQVAVIASETATASKWVPESKRQTLRQPPPPVFLTMSN